MYIIFFKYITHKHQNLKSSAHYLSKLIKLNWVDHALNTPKWRHNYRTKAIKFYAIPSLGFGILSSALEYY
jgi:hypothetical protein